MITPTIQQAIAVLSTHREEWQAVCDFVREERENCIADLGPCDNPHEVMKLSGGISRLHELLQVFNAPFV